MKMASLVNKVMLEVGIEHEGLTVAGLRTKATEAIA